MKNKYVLVLVMFYLSVIFFLIYLFYIKVLELNDKKVNDVYREAQYSGYVIKKYIDSTQHNFKTIVLKEKKDVSSILFDFEIGGFYEFVQVGDSISKQSGALKIYLKRKDFDTIVNIQIYDGNGLD